jgi:outer membrane protein assembly factor BamB
MKLRKQEQKQMAGRIGVAALALAMLGGCSTLSSLNPFARKAAPRNPPAELVAFTPSQKLTTVWSASIGGAGNHLFSPAVADGSIFVAAGNGTLARLDAATGRQQWRIEAGMPLTAGVASDGRTVAVGATDGVLLAFDGTGKLRWKAQASSEILSAPALAGDLVIVRSMDNRIAAFDVESGARRWVVQRTAPSLTLRAAPGIAVAGPTAFVALPGGRLLALATVNGGPRWEVAIGDPRGATELERIADVSGMPAVAGNEVCAVAYQGRIGCVDAGSGAGRWAKPFSSSVGVGADQDYVYAADEGGAVHAFTLERGSSVWRNSELANRGLSAPVPFGRTVAVGDRFGYIHLLSRENGAFIARAASDGSPIRGTPITAGTNLIVQTQAGTVVALAAE